MIKRESVSLFIVTEHPGTGAGVLLQRRGKFNFEKDAPESYPGVFQATVHGELEPGETPLQAAIREAKEELGTKAGAMIEEYKNGAEALESAETKNEIVHYYTMWLPASFPSLITLEVPDGEIKFFLPSDFNKITVVEPRHKTEGAFGEIVMFADEKNALEKAFTLGAK